MARLDRCVSAEYIGHQQERFLLQRTEKDCWRFIFNSLYDEARTILSLELFAAKYNSNAKINGETKLGIHTCIELRPMKMELLVQTLVQYFFSMDTQFAALFAVVVIVLFVFMLRCYTPLRGVHGWETIGEQ